MDQKPGARWYHHQDGLGSVVALSGAGGALLERVRYDAFGQPEFVDAAGQAAGASLKGNRFLFTGREWFAALGLQDNRHRYYQPAMGRWLSRDPIGEDGGINLYGYVGNNPVVEIDPLGLESWGLTGPYDPRAFDPKFRGGVPPLPGFPSREEHLNRNKRNKCPKKQPKDNDLQLPCQHLGGGKWHQDKLLNIIEGKGGGQGNTFRGDDGSECVYDGAGNLLPDAGNYNFAGPGTWFNPGHYYQDVAPHFLYGVGSMPGQTTVYK